MISTKRPQQPKKTSSGYVVSGARELFNSLSALELRLKMRDELQAITTVTHGFFNRPGQPPILLRAADWLLRAKEATTRFRTIKPSETFPDQVTMREQVTGDYAGE